MPLSPRAVALIPARAGSKRIVGKNIKRLGDHPLIAYTIAAALESGCFDEVIVSTEDDLTGRIATHYGATWIIRPEEFAQDWSPDIDWVTHALRLLTLQGQEPGYFALLRPTSPFRSADTLRLAAKMLMMDMRNDSLRAVEPVKQHPGKMWVLRNGLLFPLLPFETKPNLPWHSSPTQQLPVVYVQNASLEFAWTNTVTKFGTIAGEVVVPFIMPGLEGFDLNTPEDWGRCMALIDCGAATLPIVRKGAWPDAA